jgi:hypothetical protein
LRGLRAHSGFYAARFGRPAGAVWPGLVVMRWRSYLAFQRAAAAFLAISARLALDSLAALALPPLRPPMRPMATAVGFFEDKGKVRVLRKPPAA